MRKIQSIHLRMFNIIAMLGIICSFLLFFSSFLMNGASYHTFFLFLGIYLLEASMFLFGFGLFLTVLEELTNKQHNRL